METVLSGQRLTPARLNTAWTSYTPTIAATTGSPTIGNGTMSAKWCRVGKMIKVQVDLVFGSTTSFGASGAVTMSLPVAANSITPAHAGSGFIIDASASARRMMAVEMATTTTCIFVVDNNGGIATFAVPWTWTTSDVFRFEACYEAAT